MSIVLASASPRRRELLEKAGVAFRVQVSDADERIEPGMSAPQAVMHLARQKAAAVAAECRSDTVIGADTVVVFGETILGKPADADDAFRMLRMLSGETHSVYTGVCILKDGAEDCFNVCTRVTFYPLTDAQIRAYIATGEPMDKAGAYGIQGRGCTLVTEICGDYFNVVGLPVAEVCRRLEKMQ